MAPNFTVNFDAGDISDGDRMKFEQIPKNLKLTEDEAREFLDLISARERGQGDQDIELGRLLGRAAVRQMNEDAQR